MSKYNFKDDDFEEDDRDWFGRKKKDGYTFREKKSMFSYGRYGSMSDAIIGSKSSRQKSEVSSLSGLLSSMFRVLKLPNKVKMSSSLKGTDHNSVYVPFEKLFKSEEDIAKDPTGSKFDTSSENVDAFFGAALQNASLKALQTNNEYAKSLMGMDTQRPGYSVATYLNSLINTERVSREMSSNYPGYMKFIQNFKEHQYEKNYEPISPEDEKGKRLLDLVTRIVRFPDKITKEEQEEFNEEINAFRSIFDEYKGIPETFEECEELSNKVAKYIKIEAQEPPPQDGKGEGEGDGEGENDGEGSGKDSGDLDAIAKAMSKGLLHTDEGEEDESRMNMVSKEFDKFEDDVKNESDISIQYDDSMADIGSKILFVKVAEEYNMNSAKSKYLRVLNELDMAKAAALRNLFKRQQKDQNFVLKSMKSGRFDTNKLAEAKQHVPSVYEKIGNIKTNKICLGLLIDESGSMGGSKIEKAQQAAIFLNEIFGKQADIEFFVYGHTADRKDYSTEILVYREPGKTAHKHALGAVTAKSNNRDGHAILAAARRIRKFTNNPAILFVISDGAPAAYHYDNGRKDTRDKVQKVEKMGFQVIQIAIDSYVPSAEMFTHFVKMTNINDLPKDLVNYMSRKVSRMIKETVTL